ncbi:prepilin-type N-terminal cleavage/methylation domain-containing protein [Haliangium sp.]|uniref:prepilin-type N-terminal cleavage/methylation domain-containing protein n=1 Tax=Haliangium sp. TaxID=2663208 RepID=UPI003D0CFA6E
MAAARTAAREAGFTLLEVLLALSILALALVGLMGRTLSNVRLSQEVAMHGVAVNLARGKMYDLEATLLDEGFQELEQTVDGDFSEQGWPDIHWEAVIEKTEIPGLAGLEAMQEGAGGEGEGQGQGDGAAGGVLGGLLSLGAGPGAGGEGGGGGEAAFISSQFEMIRQILEESIRKVTLTVTWNVGVEEQKLVVACYYTDPTAMSRVLPGLGGLGGGGGIGGVGGETGGSGRGGSTGGGLGGGGRSGGAER